MENFLAPAAAQSAMSVLTHDTPWRDDTITLFGKTHLVPRRTALYGDSDATYTYSRIRMTPLPWTPMLNALRADVAAAAQQPFNAVLLNLYRDGRDSNGWHADDEPELGPDPVIASMSLGATRVMQFKRRDGNERFALDLPSGSLLIMRGDSQRDWLHCIPKRRGVTEPRINLTFRFIAPHHGGSGH